MQITIKNLLFSILLIGILGCSSSALDRKINPADLSNHYYKIMSDLQDISKEIGEEEAEKLSKFIGKICRQEIQIGRVTYRELYDRMLKENEEREKKEEGEARRAEEEQNEALYASKLLNTVQYHDEMGEEIDHPKDPTKVIPLQDWMTLRKITTEEYREAKTTAFKSYEHTPHASATGVLEVVCANKTILLEDQDDCPYIYYGHTKALGGIHIVYWKAPEGDGFTLYSMKTGEEMYSTGSDFPRVSPNSRYAIYIGDHGATDPIGCRITLFDLSSGGFEEIFCASFKNWWIDYSQDAFWGKDGAYYCAYGKNDYMKIILHKINTK